MRLGLWLLLITACAKGEDADHDGFFGKEDCDDEDASVFPDAPERCDGRDNDCDALVDDADGTLAPGVPEFFVDGDGDGQGGASAGQACSPPAGAVRDGGDCNDANAAVFVGAPEECDGFDNDCDLLIDDADPPLDRSEVPVWYRDVDGDGYGSAADLIWACVQPEGYVADATDCDDSPEGGDRNPGAPEICDGKDNNCDIATGLLVDDADPAVDLSTRRLWYQDWDGDGQGDVLSAVQACTPPPGSVDNGDDCNDRDAEIHVGHVEACDGKDNDCDGLVDGAAWWDPAWPYRVLVDLDAPPEDVLGPPVAADVNFAQALTLLGDPSDFDPDSVRVVVQDCVHGYVEVPSEFIDGLHHIFDKRSMASPLGDEAGAVVFRYDMDGDYSTSEVMAGGSSVSVGIYFGSVASGPGVAPPAYASGLQLTTGGAPGSPMVQIDTVTTNLVLDSTQGGLSDVLGLNGLASVGAQTANVFGNGMYCGPVGGGAGGGWVSAVTTPATTFGAVHSGPVMAMSRSMGAAFNDYGGFNWTYHYFAFFGRPEVYAKVVYTLDRESNIGPQGTYWTAAVRPWQTDNLALSSGGGGVGARDDTSFRWVHGSYQSGALGVYMGYRVEPEAIGSPLAQTDGRYLALAAQDYDPTPTGNQVTLPAGTKVVDGTVLVIYPHTGSAASVSDDFFGIAEGVRTVVKPADAAP